MLKWLAVLVVFMALALVHAARAAGPSADTAQTSVKVTQLPSVSVTRDYLDWLALFFSGGLVLVGIFGVIAANRTLNSINRQAVLQFRPKLTIRRILIYRGTQIPTIEGSGDIPWQVGFDIGNNGGSVAYVRECHFSLIRLESELPPRPTHFVQTRPCPFSLAPGEERELSIEFDENMTNLFRLVGEDGLRQGWQNTDRIYFYGIARYTDDVGILRTISVCRQYQNATRRFKVIEYLDYEYADYEYAD